MESLVHDEGLPFGVEDSSSYQLLRQAIDGDSDNAPSSSQTLAIGWCCQRGEALALAGYEDEAIELLSRLPLPFCRLLTKLQDWRTMSQLVERYTGDAECLPPPYTLGSSFTSIVGAIERLQLPSDTQASLVEELLESMNGLCLGEQSRLMSILMSISLGLGAPSPASDDNK